MKYFKRFSILALFLTVFSVSSWSIPARHGWITHIQPDGSEVRLCLRGDEFGHHYVDEEGRAVMQDSSGYFRPIADCELEELRAVAKIRRQQHLQVLTRSENENKTQVPHLGSPRVPVLLVQYRDKKFRSSNPKETFEQFFNTGRVSALSYFRDQSRGKFTPQFDVYGPYTLSENRKSYGANNRQGIDKGVGKMVAQGCLGLDNEIEFSRYDNDGDGECDVVIVLYAGDGEASSSALDAEDAIWPAQWGLKSSDYGSVLKLDGTVVDLFAVFNELNGDDLTKMDGIGTFCHEFSHCLGLPDFYDTDYGPHFGMGVWSVMDYGSYNNDGYTPLGYSAYEKEFMGWFEIPEASADTFYTLRPQGIPADKDDAVRLTNAADKNEYYILETRKKEGWDAFMPAEGLLITHFAYNALSWQNNTVNNFNPQRATVIPADNSLKLDRVSGIGETYYQINKADLAGDLWPYGGVNELTDTSTPMATVNTGGRMGKPITEITRNDDGSVSFWVMKGMPPSGVKVIMPDTESSEDADGGYRWYTLQGYPLCERPSAPGIYLRMTPDGNYEKHLILR